MKKDIVSRQDIEALVNAFYVKVKSDNLIGFYFKDVVKVDWEKHLPIMIDFWENVLFYTGNYSGNPMESHRKVHELHPLTMKHFSRWNHLFSETVDEMFEGKNAELIKEKAQNIATVIQVKLFNS